MAKKSVFTGMLALALTFGMMIAGCEDPNSGGGGGGGDDPTPDVPSNPGPGDTRATLSAGGAVSAGAADTGKAVTFTGATGLSLGAADFAVSSGGTISTVGVASGTASVNVTFAANSATSTKTYTVSVAAGSTKIKGSATVVITQAAAAQTPPPEPPALTGTVSISGTAQVGQTLTAVTSALTSPQGTPAYQWKRAGSTNIGTNATYAVVADDVGYTLTVTVTYSGNSGSVTSGATSAVTPPVPSTPTSVSAAAASTSSITVGWTTVRGAASYKVYRSGSSGGTYSLVGSPASNTYTDTGLSTNTMYYYKVTAVNIGGESGQSGYVSATTMAVGSPTITVGFNYGEITITGSDGSNVISKSGAYGPTSLSLSATGYTSVLWYVDSQTSISGSPAVLNAGDYTAQMHSIIFTGEANGHRYSSQPIPFTVLP